MSTKINDTSRYIIVFYIVQLYKKDGANGKRTVYCPVN